MRGRAITSGSPSVGRHSPVMGPHTLSPFANPSPPACGIVCRFLHQNNLLLPPPLIATCLSSGWR